MGDSQVDWDKYRDWEGFIDLEKMYEEVFPNSHKKGLLYIKKIIELQPIRSKQVAATIVVTAVSLDNYT